jgi:hypothetical protein
MYTNLLFVRPGICRDLKENADRMPCEILAAVSTANEESEPNCFMGIKQASTFTNLCHCRESTPNMGTADDIVKESIAAIVCPRSPGNN